MFFDTTYAWDVENRLVNVTLANGTMLAYAYSARNLRVSEAADDDVTYVLHDFYDFHGFDDVIAEYNETGGRGASFAHGPDVDEPLTVTRTDTSYFLRDGMGSISAMTGPTGETERTFLYAAFGQLAQEPSAVDRYGFVSREIDVSGLYFNRARHYDPSTGRFMTSDPWRFIDGPNQYTYVNNNPTIYYDPSGYCHIWPIGKPGANGPTSGDGSRLVPFGGCGGGPIGGGGGGRRTGGGGIGGRDGPKPRPSCEGVYDPFEEWLGLISVPAPACAAFAYGFAREILTGEAPGNTSPWNTNADKTSHCWVACVFVKVCGVPSEVTAFLAFWLEMIQGFGSDWEIDLEAGIDGIECAASETTTCCGCCSEAWGAP